MIAAAWGSEFSVDQAMCVMVRPGTDKGGGRITRIVLLVGANQGFKMLAVFSADVRGNSIRDGLVLKRPSVQDSQFVRSHVATARLCPRRTR